MDANSVWKWRIMHAKKYSENPEPFHHSSKIGLDFNVGSNSQKKVDLHLVTNGVILEVCDFAQTVTQSKWHFITNILENNFDLDLKNEQQQIEFTSQILHKVRNLIQKPPKDKHEVFPLFDTSLESECTSKDKDGLNMASTEYETDCFLDDWDEDEHEDKLKCSEAPSKDHVKTEDMDGPHADNSDDVDELECSKHQSTEELKENGLPSLFPCCAEIGLSLDVKSKQNLDPGLLTKGVMLEIVHFANVLMGSCRSIILSVLKHNFELPLKSQQEKKRIWLRITHLLKKRKGLLSTGSKVNSEFQKEPFSFEKKGCALSTVAAPLYPFKEVSKRRRSDLKNKLEKRALLATRESVTKRCRKEEVEQGKANTLSHHTDLCLSQTVEDDHKYICPLYPDKITDSGNGEKTDALQNPISIDSCHDSESSCSGACKPPLTATTDGSSSLPVTNSNVNLTSSQLDERLCGGKEKTEVLRHVPYKYDMKEEEMEADSNMWKLRSNRGQQILYSLDKAFTKSKSFGVEFNVGFGPKQNLSVDSLTTSVLLEVAKFALAINSSQQDFIMEILEYNFDFGQWSKDQRKGFASELMNKVRWLESSEDAVKLSKEVFELSGLVSSVNIVNQSMCSVQPEVSSTSCTTVQQCDVPALCPPDPHAESKEHRVDLYPFCKDIGLKLNVISSQPNRKIEIDRLTNGAMTEVTNFAEKLCGTFDQICLDILRHNFDLDWQNEDSDLSKTILTQIPIIMEQKNLSTCITASKKIKHTMKDFSAMAMGCQRNTNLDAHSTSSSQAPNKSQNVEGSTDDNYEDDLDLWMWKLRTKQIQQILSVPHGEHCLFYSYSRCKKLGLDFNVGSGVKQRLHPKLLTNGIMVEVNTLATALHAAQKYFITEILEYNFPLNLKNELCRTIFAQQVLDKYRTLRLKNRKSRILKMTFDLPDSRSIEHSSYPKTKYCPKCHQDRNLKLRQDESDPDHMLYPRPHSTTDSVSAEADCSAQKSTKDLSSAFQAAEETIMNNYPVCQKIGIRLCVDNDKPKDKVDPCLFTRGAMIEVVHFAKRLCGTKHKLINDVLEHNFDLGTQGRDLNPALQFHRMAALHNKGPTWFDEVFVIQPCTYKHPADVSKLKEVLDTQKNERKETTKKRKLALQTKEQAPLPSDVGVVKSKKTPKYKPERFPACKEIGLDLDRTTKSADKEKLDLKLLTGAVVLEIYKFAIKQVGHYFPGLLYDIFDHNFDISSQHHRRWEFAIATATKVKNMVKHCRRNSGKADVIFDLPFVFDSKAPQRVQTERQNGSGAEFESESGSGSGSDSETESAEEILGMTTNGGGRFVRQIRYHSDANRVYFLDMKSNEDSWFYEEETKFQTSPETTMDIAPSPVSGGCHSFLQGNIQVKQEEDSSHYSIVKSEPDEYYVQYEDVMYVVKEEPEGYTFVMCPKSESHIKTESETEDVQYYTLAEPQSSQGYAVLADTDPESSVKTESDPVDVKYEIPVEAAGSQEYSIITICQDNESTSIKEEPNVPVFIVEMFQSEVGLKQEQDI